MSMMYCFECDRAIDTDYFMNGHQFEPDFKCEDCLEKVTPKPSWPAFEITEGEPE